MGYTLRSVLLLSVGVCWVAGAPVDSVTKDMTSKTDQMNFFNQYGYMGSKSPDPRIQALSTEEQYLAAIRDFQAFNGLEVTGEMDAATIALMGKPRCGMPDMVNKGDIMKRRKRFAPEGSKWETATLTYYIKNYSPDLDQEKQADEIKRAFETWADVSSLKFIRVYQAPYDIEILFGPGEHGDGIPFDGANGVLAHAFFPQYGGDAHFDESETWTADTTRGINLFQVAAHEFGHSLGLSHSNVNSALMAPYYQGYQSDFMLHDDDIMGIQYIYGKPQASTTTPRPGTTTLRPTMDPDNMPDFCLDSSFDAISRLNDGYTYAFKGSNVYRLLSAGGVASGYPKKISELFSGVPSNLDAVLSIPAKYDYYYVVERVNGRYQWVRKERVSQEAATWFFKDTQCYKYDHQSEQITQHNMATQFSGVPTPIDAAFVWSGNNKVYFTKGTDYYRWEMSNYVPSSYPRSVKAAWGVDSMDAAMKWSNGKMYFFVGDQYYRYNDQTYTIDATSPPYPRQNSKWWWGCTTSSIVNMDDEMKDDDNDMMEIPGIMSNGTDLTAAAAMTTVAPATLGLTLGAAFALVQMLVL